MDKLAQRRSLRSKFLEKVHLPGKALEALHPEFADVMDRMREIDAGIREICDDVKPLIRAARSSNRQRDYLAAAFSIAEFHRRVRHATVQLGNFIKSVDVKHFNYLLDQFDSSNKEQLLSYDPTAEIKEAAEIFEGLTKEAGPIDYIIDSGRTALDYVGNKGHNLLTQKGLSNRLVEKRFNTSFMKKVKTMTDSLVSSSMKMLSNLLSSLSAMETGISRRNIAHYVEKAKDLIAKFSAYDKAYLNYHKEIILPLKEHQSKLDQDAKAKMDEAKAVEQKKMDDYIKQQEYIRQQQINQEQQEYEEAKKSPLVNPHADVDEPTYQEWLATRKGPSAEEKKNTLDKLDWENDVVNKNPPAPKRGPFGNKSDEDVEEDYAGFLKNVLNKSQELDESHPAVSAQLLDLARRLVMEKQAGIWDVFKGKPTTEAPADAPGPMDLKKKVKPEELASDEAGRFVVDTLDLPDGNIDKSFTDIPGLSGIRPEAMRISGETVRHIVNLFFNQLRNPKFSEYASDFATKLPMLLKQGIYDGWVVSSEPVLDSHNPQDKFITVFYKLDLSKISSDLSGMAKLYIKCRVSAKHKTLTIANIRKHFDITAPQVSSSDEDDTPDLDEDPDFSDHLDQYDE